MEVIKTIQELLSGKVVVLTDENLENFLQKCKLTCSDKEEDDRDYLGLPRFVTGLKSLAATLKVSLSTVSRWKAKGLLDTVTFHMKNRNSCYIHCSFCSISVHSERRLCCRWQYQCILL